MMNKKGVELAMSTIVISIILIVVMVVLLMIFTGVWKGADLPGFVKCQNRLGGDWECVGDAEKEGLFCTPGGSCNEAGKPHCCRTGDDNS